MSEPRFLVDVSTGTIELTARDVWPDGAPENPVAADVIEAMRECGTVWRCVRDWNLDYPITITVTRIGTLYDSAEWAS